MGFAEQNSDEVGKYKVKIFNGCIRNLHLISHFVTASPLGEALRKMTHLWVVSNNCMAGRPIKKRTCALPVKVRAMPENKIPPAMRVDIYYLINVNISGIEIAASKCEITAMPAAIVVSLPSELGITIVLSPSGIERRHKAQM